MLTESEKSLFYDIKDIKDSKIHELFVRYDLNGVLFLILYDVEGPLNGSDKARESGVASSFLRSERGLDSLLLDISSPYF